MDPLGAPRLEIVALAGAAGGRAETATLLRPPLEGVREGGTYVFLVPPAPLGFVTGTVGGVAGGPQEGALVTSDTAPFADVTGPDGRYVVAGTAGAVLVTALLPATGDRGSGQATVGGRDDLVALDVAIEAVGPTVVSISPPDGAVRVPLDASIRVVFSEPVDPASVPAAFTVSTNPGLAGSVRVAPDGRAATFTPAARLAPATVHTVALGAGVRDLAGNALAPFSASFTTLDPALVRDPGGLISATAPDADGRVTVTGGPGTGEPGQAVALVNHASGVVETVTAGADGSFTVSIAATLADTLTVNLATAAGTQTSVPIGAFRHPDGSVTVGPAGGRVSADTADGPLTLDVPAGAFDGPVIIKIVPFDAQAALDELDRVAPGLAFPPDVTHFAALRIEAPPGAIARTKLTLSVPVPAGVEAAAASVGRTLADVQATLTRVETLEADAGVLEPAFVEVDRGKVIDGRLTTATPPHAGVGGVFGAFYFFFPFPLVFQTYASGQVLISDDPADPQKPRLPAPGAVVRGFVGLAGTPLFHAVADGSGHFAVTISSAGSGETIGAFSRRPDAFQASASVRTTNEIIAGLPDLVMKRRKPPKDEVKPEVRIVPGGGVIPLGVPTTVVVSATDNDSRPENRAILESSLIAGFRVTGPGTFPIPGLSRDPADGRLKTTFTPNVAGPLRIDAEARDIAGNIGRATGVLTVGALAPTLGNLPAGDPREGVPPVVVGIDPEPGAAGVSTASPITVRFSEAVDRSAAQVGSDGVPLFIQVEGGGILVPGGVTIAPDQTSLAFHPAGGLRPGTIYTVTVQGLTDLVGNVFDQDACEPDIQAFVSRFSTLDAASPTPITGLGFNLRTGRESTVLGTTLFFTDADSSEANGRILIYDVANPRVPVKLAEIDVQGQPRAMLVLPEFTWAGFAGQPTFPPSKGFKGKVFPTEDPSVPPPAPVPADPPAEPGALLIAAVQRLVGTNEAGSFLVYYDVTDPKNPKPIGRAERISFGSIATRLEVARERGGGRLFVKLSDSPNPGVAVVDLRLALVKATVLPVGSFRQVPENVFVLGAPAPAAPVPSSEPLIDTNGSGRPVPDFDGKDGGDGDFGDPGDELPDIGRNTSIVIGRFVSPGDTTHFDVDAAGGLVYIADGQPRDWNGNGDFTDVGFVDSLGVRRADAAGLAIADLRALERDLADISALPLIDRLPLDGLDDRVVSRLNVPAAGTRTPSSRIRLAEGLLHKELVTRFFPFTMQTFTFEREVLRDAVFVTNGVERTLTMVDVTDPRAPVRLAVLTLAKGPGGQPIEPVEMTFDRVGRRLIVEVAGLGPAGAPGTVVLDLDRLVRVDETGPSPVFDTSPVDADGNGLDDRVARVAADVPGNGAFAAGIAYGGIGREERIAPLELPRLRFVRFNGSRQDLADFDPSRPGDGANAPFIGALEPVDFLTPGRLHGDPKDPNASDQGDRGEPFFTYFVVTEMPAGAADSTGSVLLSLESVDISGTPLPDLGYGFPPTSYGSERPGAVLPSTPPPLRRLRLHRQMATQFLGGPKGQRLSPLATLYISDPIFVTREPLRKFDVQNPATGPFILWSGAKVRASLAAAAQGSNVAAIYLPPSPTVVPQTTPLTPAQRILSAARVEAHVFPAEFVDSPDPNPAMGTSAGLGETASAYTHSGEFSWTQVDLAIKGRGLHYAFVRSYESQSLYNGPMGRGFDFNYNMRLQELPEGFTFIVAARAGAPDDVATPKDVLCYDGTGRVDIYQFMGEGPDYPGDPDPLVLELGLTTQERVARHYKSPRGFFTKLLRLTDGTFILIERDGTIRRFGAHGKLLSIEDRNGNRLDFCYDRKLRLRAVIEPMGRRIDLGYFKNPDPVDEPDFVRDLDEPDPLGLHPGRIKRQRDFIGRVVDYEYDGENRLTDVVAPETRGNELGSPRPDDSFRGGRRKRTRYVYNGARLAANPRMSFAMEAVIDAHENLTARAPRVQNVYDPDDGKLKTQVWGEDANRHSIDFSYGGPMTTVADRRGHATEYGHDPFGRAETIVQKGQGLPPAGIRTTQQFNNDGLPLRTVLPEKNSIAYDYDDDPMTQPRRRAQGNLLSIERRPGPDAVQAAPRPPNGSADVLESRYDGRPYDLKFNLVRSYRDPGGFTTTFDYDERGNLEVITRPISTGIVERFFYNRFGQLDRAIDGEGNETRYLFHAEEKPDGIHRTPPPPLRPALDALTGGYLREVTVDAEKGPGNSQPGNAGPAADPRLPPGPVKLTTRFRYDDLGSPTTPGSGAPMIGYVGNPTAITNPRGVEVRRFINELNQVFKIVRAATAAVAPDPAPALEFEERIFYDGNNRVARREVQHDAAGTDFTVYEYFYDRLDNLELVRVKTGPRSGDQTLETRYEYDDDKNLIKITKPLLNVDTFEYDARRLMTGMVRGKDSLVESRSEYAYDDNGNLVGIVDGRGVAEGPNRGPGRHETLVEYDGYDRQMKVVDRMGNATESTYDDNSLVKMVTRKGPASGQGRDRFGVGAGTTLQDVELFYDEVYRRTKVKERVFPPPVVGDELNETETEYDRASRVVRVRDDNDHELKIYYDGASRVVTRVDEVGNEIAFAYDQNGNVIGTVETERTSPAGGADETFRSSATYDALDRVRTTTDPSPDDHTRTFEFDAQSNLVRTIDAEGNVVRAEYDLVGRRTAMVKELRDPAGAPAGQIATRWRYDRNSRLEEMEDDRGNRTRYEDYDALDRLGKTTFADATTIVVDRYDENDNVLVLVDQNGNRIASEYDDSDRLFERRVTLARGTPLGDFDAVLEAYEYDGLDRMTLARDEDSVCTRKYDSLSRVIEEQETRVGVPPRPPTLNAYDAVGNRLRLTYPSGLVVDHTYDPLDRIDTIVSAIAPAPLADYDYVGRGRVTRRAFSNGVACTYGYDEERLPTKVAHLGPAASAGQPHPTAFDFRYEWTREHRRAGEQRMHEGGTVDFYSYDSIYRLTKAQRGTRLPVPIAALDAPAPTPRPSPVQAALVRTYAQDGTHNLTTVATATPADPRAATSFPESFAVDRAPGTSRNQYAALTEAGVPRTQGHDPNGNTTALRLERRSAASPLPTFAEATVEYDYRDQPIRVTFPGTPGDQIIYRYDALGRRIEKSVASGVTTVTRFLHDGDREIEERDGTDTPIARYIYGIGLDEVLVMDRPGGPVPLVFYHQNSIGSVAGITDASGREVERYRYDAYGAPILERVDNTPPTVFRIRTVGPDLEIDFTESLAPLDFTGLVTIGGTPALAIDLQETVVTIPSGNPGIAGPAFRATLLVTPAIPLGPGPVTVTVNPGAGANAIADVSLNPLAAPFVVAAYDPVTGFVNPTAQGTGAEQIALSAAGNPWLFQGRRFDPETGLFYYRARYYSPATGRFLQNDPKGYVDGANLYTAFGNDPVNRVDPFGTQAQTATSGVAVSLAEDEPELVVEAVVEATADPAIAAFRPDFSVSGMLAPAGKDYPTIGPISRTELERGRRLVELGLDPVTIERTRNRLNLQRMVIARSSFFGAASMLAGDLAGVDLQTQVAMGKMGAAVEGMAGGPNTNRISRLGQNKLRAGRGHVSIEQGAKPSRDEIEAARTLAEFGMDVTHRQPASRRGIDEPTSDLYAEGIGTVEAYRSQILTSLAMSREIAKKGAQAPTVMVRAKVPREVRQETANRVWGKREETAKKVQTIIFHSEEVPIDIFTAPSTSDPVDSYVGPTESVTCERQAAVHPWPSPNGNGVPGHRGIGGCHARRAAGPREDDDVAFPGSLVQADQPPSDGGRPWIFGSSASNARTRVARSWATMPRADDLRPGGFRRQRARRGGDEAGGLPDHGDPVRHGCDEHGVGDEALARPARRVPYCVSGGVEHVANADGITRRRHRR